MPKSSKYVLRVYSIVIQNFWYECHCSGLQPRKTWEHRFCAILLPLHDAVVSIERVLWVESLDCNSNIVHIVLVLGLYCTYCSVLFRVAHPNHVRAPELGLRDILRFYELLQSPANLPAGEQREVVLVVWTDLFLALLKVLPPVQRFCRNWSNIYK